MLDKIKEIIAEQLKLDPASVDDDADLAEDLGADSLDAVEILVAIEEAFGISVPDEDVASGRTPKEILKYIEERAAGGKKK